MTPDEAHNTPAWIDRDEQPRPHWRERLPEYDDWADAREAVGGGEW